MTQINDRSAPILESEFPAGSWPHAEHCRALQGPCPSGSQQLLIGGLDNSKLNLFASLLSEPKGSGGGSYGSGSAAIQPKGGLFQGGVPKLRPVGAKDCSGNGHRPVVCVGVPGEGPEQEGVKDLTVYSWGFRLLRGRTPNHIPMHGTGQLCPP